MDAVIRVRRTHRRVFAMAAAVLILAGWAGVNRAQAGPPATGACPDGFHLEPISFLDNYSVGGLKSADLNGNGMTCVKLLNTPSDIVFMDDVVPN